MRRRSPHPKTESPRRLCVLIVLFSAVVVGSMVWTGNTLPARASAGQETPPESAWIELKKGLRYHDVTVGEGDEARRGSQVTVHYTGWLPDGTVFDTSRKSGAASLSFRLGEGRVVRGWEMGVPGMRAGGTRRLFVPAKLAYGRRGVPGRIPPNTDLEFEIELLSVSR